MQRIEQADVGELYQVRSSMSPAKAARRAAKMDMLEYDREKHHQVAEADVEFEHVEGINALTDHQQQHEEPHENDSHAYDSHSNSQPSRLESLASVERSRIYRLHSRGATEEQNSVLYGSS